MIRKIIILIIIMFSFFSKVNAQYDQLATHFKFAGIDGNLIDFRQYKNKTQLSYAC